MNDPYVYRPLADATNYRIMHLAPGKQPEDIWFSLTEHIEEEIVLYEAISYAWGSTQLTHTIYSNDGFLKITQNLFNALRRYRLADRPVSLWVDAICISQSDLAERARQVQLMGKIFSESCKVLVWFGEQTTTDKPACDFIQKVVRTHWHRLESNLDDPTVTADATLELLGELQSNDLITCLSNFFEKTWFSRAWTLQEIISAPSATVSCGHLEVSYESIFAFGILCFALGFVNIFPSPTAVMNLSQITATKMLRENHRKGNANIPFAYFVNSGRARASTEPHDKIYSLLGIASQADPLPYPPDYSIEVSQLYQDFARHAIRQSNSLDILSLCRFEDEHSSVPSWAPDWRIQHSSPLHPYLNRIYEASRDHPMRMASCSKETDLVVEGFVFDRIACLSSNDLDWSFGSVLDTSFVKAKYVNMLALIQETQQMASTSTRYLDTDERFEAWWRTLIGDRTRDGQRATHETALEFEVFRQLLANVTAENPVQAPTNEEIYKAAKVERMVHLIAALRKFCVTEQGRIGWVCQNAMPGDLVALLFGCDTPVLLRPQNDSFLMIETCYIHGAMFGEAMTEHNSVKARPFRLI